jgi:hypothetical protein
MCDTDRSDQLMVCKRLTEVGIWYNHSLCLCVCMQACMCPYLLITAPNSEPHSFNTGTNHNRREYFHLTFQHVCQFAQVWLGDPMHNDMRDLLLTQECHKKMQVMENWPEYHCLKLGTQQSPVCHCQSLQSQQFMEYCSNNMLKTDMSMSPSFGLRRLDGIYWQDIHNTWLTLYCLNPDGVVIQPT